MSCGNPLNHFFKNAKESLLNLYSIQREVALYGNLASTSKPKYADEVMECLQFGICEVAHPKKEIPYFHF